VTFGEYLRLHRESVNISLEEVFENTRIRPALLRALEADDIEALPPLPIIKGFVRAYASFVGLPPEDSVLRLLDQLDPESSGTDGQGSRLQVFAKLQGMRKKVRVLLTGNEGHQLF